MEIDLNLYMGVVLFALSTFLLFFKLESTIYQKVTTVFMTLSNGLMLYLSAISLSFEYTCLLIAGMLLAELIVFGHIKFSACVLLSSAYLFVMLSTGAFTGYINSYLTRREGFPIDSLQFFVSQIAGVLFSVLLLFKPFWIQMKKTVNSRLPLDYITTCTILMNVSLMMIFQFVQNHEYRLLFNVSLLGLYLLFWGYIFFTQDIEEIRHNEKIIVKQLDRQLRAYQRHMRYLDETGVFRHDIKGKLRDVSARYKEGERLDGLEVLEEIGEGLAKIKVERKLSNNCFVDAILKAAEDRCIEKDVDFKASLYIPPDAKIDDIFLIRTFSSLIDCALDANQTVEEGKRFIKVESALKSGWASVSICFSYDGKSFSQKERLEENNYSVDEICSLVESMDGIMHINIDEITKTVTLQIHIFVSEV